MSAVARHSKRLSYLLRHHPEAAGLTLDPAGWVSVGELLAATGLGEAELERAVAQNDKNRFEWDREEGRIRARQGHSTPVDLGLTPVAPPPVLYHGTHRGAVEPILREGLRHMARQHVHLSATVEVAREVGGRRGRGEAVVLQVDATGLVAAGHPVFQSSNGVYLTDGVPAALLQLWEREPG